MMVHRVLLVAGYLLAACLGGCIFHSYSTVTVDVNDAETGQPIAGATVVANPWSNEIIDLTPAKTGKAITDENGRARVRAAKSASVGWSADAPGYLESRPWLLKGESPGKLLLYREPAPTICIVLPDGYRGLVRIQVKPVQQHIQQAPGPRTFTFHASSDGLVRIEATPLLEHIWSIAMDFRYDSGVAIPKEKLMWTAADEVVMRPLKDVADGALFVLGTKADADRLRELTLTTR